MEVSAAARQTRKVRKRRYVAYNQNVMLVHPSNFQLLTSSASISFINIKKSHKQKLHLWQNLTPKPKMFQRVQNKSQIPRQIGSCQATQLLHNAGDVSTQNSKQKSWSLLHFWDITKQYFCGQFLHRHLKEKKNKLHEVRLGAASNCSDTPLNASCLPATTENIRCASDVSV